MTPELHALHIAAGLRVGRDRTCGKKIAYSSEESAADEADAMNVVRRAPDLFGKPRTRNFPETFLEAYPCAFCEKWHVDRTMSTAELWAVAYEPLVSEELAGIPTSLLLRDVIAHGCDRLDGEKLCDRCRGKWAEIDRRLPTRMGKP